VGGRPRWLWAFVSEEVTAYSIQPGRDFEQETVVLPADYAGGRPGSMVHLRGENWRMMRKPSKLSSGNRRPQVTKRCRVCSRVANRVPAHINGVLCFQRLMLDGLAVAATGPKGRSFRLPAIGYRSRRRYRPGGRSKQRPYRSAAGGTQVLCRHRLEACATESAVRTLFPLFSRGEGRENVSTLDTYAIMKLWRQCSNFRVPRPQPIDNH